jgi:hypothetical protein
MSWIVLISRRRFIPKQCRDQAWSALLNNPDGLIITFEAHKVET